MIKTYYNGSFCVLLSEECVLEFKKSIFQKIKIKFEFVQEGSLSSHVKILDTNKKNVYKMVFVNTKQSSESYLSDNSCSFANHPNLKITVQLKRPFENFAKIDCIVYERKKS